MEQALEAVMDVIKPWETCGRGSGNCYRNYGHYKALETLTGLAGTVKSRVGCKDSGGEAAGSAH